MENTLSVLSDFIANIKYEDLPLEVVIETKKVLLDSMGCALAGTLTPKGELSLLFGRRSESAPESTLIGHHRKVSSSVAAFVNGELLTALDYDPLFSPFGHITPYVLSAPLAVSEWKKSSGKELVVAIVLAHEIAQRIATGFVAAKKIVKKTSQKDIILYPPIPGYGANVFGGVAGVSKILGLTKDKVEHAMGIGGYMCPIPTLIQFAESVPSSMSKYSPSGWISQAGLTAALLSEMGYTGDKNILDGEFGFWRSFGADGWRPEVVVQGLGVRWYLPEMISYKRYPCCGAMHAALDILNAIINQYDLYPEDIKELNVVLNLLAEFNLWKNREIKTHIEAQFSPAYVFSLACHRIETGYQWQIPQTYKDRKILGFMNKINIFTPASPEYTNKEHVVEVILYDKQTGREKTYTENDVLPVGFSINDEELYAKFRHNAKELLPSRKTEQLLQNVLNVDYLDDISRLMEPFKML